MIVCIKIVSFVRLRVMSLVKFLLTLTFGII